MLSNSIIFLICVNNLKNHIFRNSFYFTKRHSFKLIDFCHLFHVFCPRKGKEKRRKVKRKKVYLFVTLIKHESVRKRPLATSVDLLSPSLSL